jgi:hypothetical protein
VHEEAVRFWRYQSQALSDSASGSSKPPPVLPVFMGFHCTAPAGPFALRPPRHQDPHSATSQMHLHGGAATVGACPGSAATNPLLPLSQHGQYKPLSGVCRTCIFFTNTVVTTPLALCHYGDFLQAGAAELAPPLCSGGFSAGALKSSRRLH